MFHGWAMAVVTIRLGIRGIHRVLITSSLRAGGVCLIIILYPTPDVQATNHCLYASQARLHDSHGRTFHLLDSSHSRLRKARVIPSDARSHGSCPTFFPSAWDCLVRSAGKSNAPIFLAPFVNREERVGRDKKACFSGDFGLFFVASALEFFTLGRREGWAREQSWTFTTTFAYCVSVCVDGGEEGRMHG